MGEEVARNTGGGCCGCLGFLLLIVGAIMYSVCKDAQTTGKCGGHEEISEAGFIMLIFGVTSVGVTILCFCIVLCFVAVNK